MLSHLQLGILMADIEGRNFLASQWGKKGTTSDITLYTLASSEFIQTTVIPSGYPKKVMPLVFTAHMSDLVLLGVPMSGLDAQVGEMAILADTLGIQGIKAVVGEHAQGMESYFTKMDKVFAQLSVKSWNSELVFDGQSAANLRDHFHTIFKGHRGDPSGYLAIEVDHAFPVQGVGSVILGTIISGTVEKGQKIKIFPEGQEGSVRSIQVNDQDERSAGPGIHVGLAMKGILPKYLQRGTVITATQTDEVNEVSELEIPVNASKYGTLPQNGDKIHVVAGLYDVPGEVVEWSDQVSLKLEKPIPYYPLERITLLDLNRKPAVLGSRQF
jgi:selenocysteine-specific translation elongation factor